MSIVEPIYKQSVDAPIRRIEVIEFNYPVADVARVKRSAKPVYQPGQSCTISSFALRIEAWDGRVGEYVPHMGGRKAVLAQVLQLAPSLVGMFSSERPKFFERGKRQLQTLGFLGVGPLDICLWDLTAKQLNTSVQQLVGSYRDRLPVYASLIHCDVDGGLATQEDLVAAGRYMADQGFKGFKFRGWSHGCVDAHRSAVFSMAENVNHSEMKLMLDPGGDLVTFADALSVGRACDEADFFWLEDPLRDTGKSMAGNRRLREKLRTSLLVTEHVRGLEAKADWVVSGATDFLRADPELDLGITGALKIACLGEAFGMDVEIHGSGPAHRICMAAMRNTNFYEMGLLTPNGTNINAPPVYSCGYNDHVSGLGADGCISPAKGLGLGVSYDWEFIRRNACNSYLFEE